MLIEWSVLLLHENRTFDCRIHATTDLAAVCYAVTPRDAAIPFVCTHANSNLVGINDYRRDGWQVTMGVPPSGSETRIAEHLASRRLSWRAFSSWISESYVKSLLEVCRHLRYEQERPAVSSLWEPEWTDSSASRYVEAPCVGQEQIESQ